MLSDVNWCYPVAILCVILNIEFVFYPYQMIEGMLDHMNKLNLKINGLKKDMSRFLH